MKQLLLLAAFVAAFSVSSVFADSCPGGKCGDKDKDDTKEESKDTEKKSLSVRVDL